MSKQRLVCDFFLIYIHSECKIILNNGKTLELGISSGLACVHLGTVHGITLSSALGHTVYTCIKEILNIPRDLSCPYLGLEIMREEKKKIPPLMQRIRTPRNEVAGYLILNPTFVG